MTRRHFRTRKKGQNSNAVLWFVSSLVVIVILLMSYLMKQYRKGKSCIGIFGMKIGPGRGFWAATGLMLKRHVKTKIKTVKQKTHWF